jgi:hypothetical protein
MLLVHVSANQEARCVIAIQEILYVIVLVGLKVKLVIVTIDAHV